MKPTPTSFVRVPGGDVLAADNPLAAPEERGGVFLASHGALVGMNDTERHLVADANAAATATATTSASTLEVAKISSDEIGATHVSSIRLIAA